MRSVRTKRFMACFDALPLHIQRQAIETFRSWQADPSRSSLEFKRIGHRLPVYSVRIGIHWRALCVQERDS